jgi:2-keto-4-pentenoate hydratase/2-oxohepta-3-ene-1,7-dioic acid hydratase in catechol pathway
MRLCRFNTDQLGIVDGSEIVVVTEALQVLPALRWPFPRHDIMIENLDIVIDRAMALMATAKRVALADVRLESPVANPSKIIAAPTNYQLHIDEGYADPELRQGRPALGTIDTLGLFLKANSSLVGPGTPIKLGDPDRRHDPEAELGVVIGRKCRNVSEADALDYVAGYAVAVDAVVRGPEDRSLRKSLDTYSVLGPWLTTKDEIADPADLVVSLSVNGEQRQRAHTSGMIWSVRRLIAFASAYYTLFPGDIIMSGTPEGVSEVKPGDTVVVGVDKVGDMTLKIERGAWVKSDLTKAPRLTPVA